MLFKALLLFEICLFKRNLSLYQYFSFYFFAFARSKIMKNGIMVSPAISVIFINTKVTRYEKSCSFDEAQDVGFHFHVHVSCLFP